MLKRRLCAHGWFSCSPLSMGGEKQGTAHLLVVVIAAIVVVNQFMLRAKVRHERCFEARHARVRIAKCFKAIGAGLDVIHGKGRLTERSIVGEDIDLADAVDTFQKQSRGIGHCGEGGDSLAEEILKRPKRARLFQKGLIPVVLVAIVFKLVFTVANPVHKGRARAELDAAQRLVNVIEDLDPRSRQAGLRGSRRAAVALVLVGDVEEGELSTRNDRQNGVSSRQRVVEVKVIKELHGTRDRLLVKSLGLPDRLLCIRIGAAEEARARFGRRWTWKVLCFAIVSNGFQEVDAEKV